MWFLFFVACGPSVTAIYDPSRAEHFFDVPFPSNDAHVDDAGHATLAGWPLAATSLAAGIERGWVERIATTTAGFSNNGSAYFRFDGPLELPTQTEGTTEDPVLLIAIDGSELLPLELRFVEDPLGDAHWGPNTLALAPRLGHPPRSGETYAAVVMTSAGAKAPAQWDVPSEVGAALDTAGVRGRVAMATVFTVQDGTAQLRTLFADSDQRISDAIYTDTLAEVAPFRRVAQLDFQQGNTPSGKAATVSTATFEDGSKSVAYLADNPEADVRTVDMIHDWPAAVYEGHIPVLNYQDEDDRPYMNPGVFHATDTERMTGWIDFEPDGTLISEPWIEWMRVVVSLPKGSDGAPIENAPVLVWDHGTGGQAYEIVHRPFETTENSRAMASVFAEAGVATIGHDATLYGQRFPLIDLGYGAQLGFYNVVNLPAFRDNQRQTAVDAHLLQVFVREHLNDYLPAGSVDKNRMRKGGHSLGSVTSNLGLAAAPQAWDAGFLSGTGGVFTHYFLDTGLLTTIEPTTLQMLFGLFGAQVPEEVNTVSIAGTVLGLSEPAWEHLDRLHPFFTLFQWLMDPSDPMAVARDETLPIALTIAPGDLQTPAFTAEALSNALPDATVYPCEARGDYDPHLCFFREPEGWSAVKTWLNETSSLDTE